MPVSSYEFFEDFVNQWINSLKTDHTIKDFRIIESLETTLSNNSAYKILYSYKILDEFGATDEYTYKDLIVLSKIGLNYYAFKFNSIEDYFVSHLPTINKVLEYTKIPEVKFTLDKKGIPIAGSPIDIAINTITNKIYVAVP